MNSYELNIPGVGIVKTHYQYINNRIMVSHNHINNPESYCEHSYKSSANKDQRKFIKKLIKDIKMCNDPGFQNAWKPSL